MERAKVFGLVGWFLFVCLLVIMGFELRALRLLRRQLNTYTSPFCFSYFGDEILLFTQASLDHDLSIYASSVTGAYHHTQLFVEIGVSQTFCLG
jgi:hypothetical protein